MLLKSRSMAILIFFIISFLAPFSSSLETPSHFIKHGNTTTTLPQSTPQKYMEIKRPLSFANSIPSCVFPILTHKFGNTIGLPPVTVAYSPPDSCSWTHVAVKFSGSCKGVQYDRIAAVWLDGVELLRTSTPDPTDTGVYWNVTKDVTRYSSILSRKNSSLSVVLENVVNDVYTGVYHVNITFIYYDVKQMEINVPLSRTSNRKVKLEDEVFVKKPIRSSVDLYEEPADLIIPISDEGSKGSWFRIQSESELHGKSVMIPKNTYRAVMEIYVSSHGYDEFWYSNPPDSYIQINNLTSRRGHGSYREVLLNIDLNSVGSVVPFPVIFSGGVNPLFWDPVVSIGAFDLPTYDIDLTPFLGLLLDGKSHFVWLGVANSIPFWLVNANLHLWVDKQCRCAVQAKLVEYRVPEFEIERSSDFEGLDGSYEIEMERKTQYTGWVKSMAAGNLTTTVTREVKLKSKIKFSDKGNEKKVKQKVKEEVEVKVESETGATISHTTVKREYPLYILTKTKESRKEGTRMSSELENEYQEKRKSKTGESSSINLKNKQKCKGWMAVQEHIVLNGGATTEQSYSYNGEDSKYSREITATNGKLSSDSTTANYLNYASFSAM